ASPRGLWSGSPDNRRCVAGWPRSCSYSTLERGPPREWRPSGDRSRPGARIVPSNILILGASYGSLFGTKLLLAGHRVSLVCTAPTAELINREGTVVRFPVRGQAATLDVPSKKLPGSLVARTPDEVAPAEFDLVVLGMQEAQHGSPGLRDL